MTVFADTHYWLARLNRMDANHHRAAAAARLAHRIYTTDFVLIELADALAPTGFRHLVQSVRQTLQASSTDIIIPASTQWLARGEALYLARPDKQWSLTDCVSFEVMRDHSLTHALTGDHHFEQAGYVAMLR